MPGLTLSHSFSSSSSNFFRLLLASFGFICAIGIKPSDVLYNTLPLYHSLGIFLFLPSITHRVQISFFVLGGWVCITHRYVLIDTRWRINRFVIQLVRRLYDSVAKEIFSVEFLERLCEI